MPQRPDKTPLLPPHKHPLPTQHLPHPLPAAQTPHHLLIRHVLEDGEFPPIRGVRRRGGVERLGEQSVGVEVDDFALEIGGYGGGAGVGFGDGRRREEGLVGVGVRGDVVGFHGGGEGHEGVVYGVDGYLKG